MRRLDDVRLVQRLDRPGKQPVMQIAIENKAIEQWLPGAWLEEVFSSPNGDYLVFSTDDCPFEEGLNIILLSSTGHLLDVKTISSLYSTGYPRDLRVEDPQTVLFSFFDSDLWRVQVSPGPLKPRPKWIPRLFWRGLQVKRLVP